MRTFLLLISLAVFGSASAQDSNFYFNDDVSGERTTLVFDGFHYTWTIDVYSVGYEVIIMGTYNVDADGVIMLVPERKGHTKLLHPQPNGSYLYTDGSTVQRLRHH
jgi:hypothetical protein